MTSNQINYAKMKEEVRHNINTEAITRDSNQIAAVTAGANAMNANTNRQKLDVEWANVGANVKNAETNLLNAQTRARELMETQRSNQAQELLGYQRNVESQRANMASEALTGERNVETQRHNVYQETLATQQQAETERHDQVSEQLTSSGQRASILSSLIGAAGNLVGKLFGR